VWEHEWVWKKMEWDILVPIPNLKNWVLAIFTPVTSQCGDSCQNQNGLGHSWQVQVHLSFLIVFINYLF